MWDKITAHPDVIAKVAKEPHWWGPRRNGYTAIPIHRPEGRVFIIYIITIIIIIVIIINIIIIVIVLLLLLLLLSLLLISSLLIIMIIIIVTIIKHSAKTNQENS